MFQHRHWGSKAAQLIGHLTGHLLPLQILVLEVSHGQAGPCSLEAVLAGAYKCLQRFFSCRDLQQAHHLYDELP